MKNYVIPPWVLYDDPPSSLMWRMGGGEDHIDKFRAYWSSLTITEKNLIIAKTSPSDRWADIFPCNND